MRTLLNLLGGNRDYRLLFGANLISTVGDWILSIGMMYYIYTITGSALAAGGMVLATIFPRFLFGSIGGVYADRWDRRVTMTVTNILLAVSLIPLFLVHDPGLIWLVYLVVVVEGSIGQFFAPAEAAMIPHIVAPDQLVAANAINAQSAQAGRLIGAAVGGVLAAFGGIALVAAVDVVSYLIAATLVARIRSAPPPRAEPPRRTTAGLFGTFRGDWWDGVRLCLGRRDLSTLLSYRVLVGLGEGTFSVLLAPLIISVLGATSAQYGAIIAAQAVGGIAGGVLIAVLGNQIPPRTLLGYGALAFGAIDLLIAIYPLALPVVWPVFLMIGVVGVPAAARAAGYATLQQLRSPEAYRGRVFGAMTAAWAIAMIAGTVLASALGDVVGIIPIIAVQGVVNLVAAPLVLLRISRAEPAVARVGDPVLATDGGAR